jgi:hypothetical protein
MDEIFPFAIGVFSCLHKQVGDFFLHCANMAWLANGDLLNIILCVQTWHG